MVDIRHVFTKETDARFICGNCGQWKHVKFSGHITSDAAKLYISEHEGWKITGDSGLLCPDCQPSWKPLPLFSPFGNTGVTKT